MSAAPDIYYRPRGRFRSQRVGAHSSTEVGGFGIFRDQVPFMRSPDARRIDIRASLRDPYEQIYVRRFEQRQSIDVIAVVDLSASMAFVGACEKVFLSCQVCETLASSVTKIGDRFGLMACDEVFRRDLFLPPTRSRRAAASAALRLKAEEAVGFGAAGFVDAARSLGAARKLVFLISDFRWPQSLLLRVFDAFSPHDVAPLVIVDSVEESPPSLGLLELLDAESGRRRVVVMRPHLHARWVEKERARQAFLINLSASRCRPPIFIRDVFEPDVVSSQLVAA